MLLFSNKITHKNLYSISTFIHLHYQKTRFMKQNLFIVLFFSFFISNIANSQNTSKGISPDTIVQNFHRSDKIQATKTEALIRMKVMDFKKKVLEGIPLWVYHKRTNQYWYGITDERGEAFFLLPNNQDYTVNVDQEEDYRKFSIQKEKDLSKTVPIVYMSTRIKEVEKNDTIYQYLTQGQMPTKSRVLVKIKIVDLNNHPLPKEELYFVSENTKKIYLALTNSNGNCTLMLPKGDTYCVHSYGFQNITCKTYEDNPNSRTSSFELNMISTAEFKYREKERARLLAQRDSIRREQRLRDSARIANMDDYNFYLQHYYGNRDFDKIEANVIKVALKDQRAIAENADYYASTNQEIKAMLYRNKDQWAAKRIVANIDCSMYPYIDQLMVWNYSDEKEQNNNTYWLFNGFQNNSKKSETDLHRRGVYKVPNNDIEGFCNTIDKIVNFSCSGNRLENVVEALIIGSENKPENEELLFIADNFSDVSDLHKLDELKVPVRVLLTDSKYGVNEHYLEIAYRTGGSIHTIFEDISSEQLQSLEDGQRLQIGKYSYQFFKGKFLKIS